MPSRRKFLGTTAAVVAATAARSTRADAATDVAATLPQQGGSLPPAIAALTPMREGVKPITVEEMLPGPDGCWLRREDGRYPSELRTVCSVAGR